MSERQQTTDSLTCPPDKALQCDTALSAGKASSSIGQPSLPIAAWNTSIKPSPVDHSVQFTTIKKPWHQLIVVGNGFDLECGLRSSFGHFIAARREYFDDPSSDDVGPEFHETIWDHLLDERNGSNWCDVERAIAEWVAPKDTRREPKTPLDLSSNRVVFGKTLTKLDELCNMGYSVQINQNETPDRVANHLFNRFHGNDTSWTKERLLNMTQQDLSTFEGDFASYLISEINRSTDYRQAADKLMKALMGFGLPSAERHEIETCVLSFNYTTPHEIFRVDGNLVSYVNIHGELGGEIVFGIDGTGRMNDPDALPYTKTYRLMALDVPNVAAVVHRGASGPSDDVIKVIKFFGHSLGQADYSYFQAIFDAVNLYDGLTSLQFFVRPYECNGIWLKEEDVRKEMMGKVINLLSSYGATLDNKDHGKNLIHKLLIEGRLQICTL